jgi:hypothetical protein
MDKWFIDTHSIAFLYSSVCDYLKLLDNGPASVKHVGNKLKTVSLNTVYFLTLLPVTSA